MSAGSVGWVQKVLNNVSELGLELEKEIRIKKFVLPNTKQRVEGTEARFDQGKDRARGVAKNGLL